eukprot:4204107-Amphidinium_carterae.1
MRVHRLENPLIGNRGSTPTPPQSQDLKRDFPKIVHFFSSFGSIFETLGLGRGGVDPRFPLSSTASYSSLLWSGQRLVLDICSA